jgi:hypothetical protein
MKKTKKREFKNLINQFLNNKIELTGEKKKKERQGEKKKKYKK